MATVRTVDNLCDCELKELWIFDDDTKAETEKPISVDVPLPPPAKDPLPRVPMNVRIRVEHDRALRRYQRKHTVTRQAVIDQALAEYLSRRGLLP